MDLKQVVLFALFCAGGAVAFAVGKELRKRKFDREGREREKTGKEREKAGKKTRNKRVPGAPQRSKMKQQ